MRSAVEGLRSAFGLTISAHTREQIADNLCFCIGGYWRRFGNLDAVPEVPEFPELARFARRWIDGAAFISIYGKTELFGRLGEIESIGQRIRLPGSRVYLRRQGGATARSLDPGVASLASRVIGLIGGQTSSEAIVRLLAGLAIVGSTPGYLEVDSTHFSPQGYVALIALNVFTDGVTGLSAQEIVRLAIDVWAHSSPITGEQEMPKILFCLAVQRPLSDYSIEVLDMLLRSHVMERRLSQAVLNGLNAVTQYRTSMLDDPERQLALGLGA